MGESEQEKEAVKITIDEDEAIAIIEELSHRPYRNTYQAIQILSARVQKAKQQQAESKIVTE